MSEHPRGRMAGWVLVALAGLAIAVVLSVAASNLSTQPIGLSNEPLRAGDRLAPPPVKTTETVKKHAVKRRRPARTQTATAPAPAVTATTPAPTTTTPGTDDHGGSGSSGGSGSGRTDDLNGRRDSDD